MDQKERYALAKKLEDILWSYDLTEQHHVALEQAINIVSPEYVNDLALEMESALLDEKNAPDDLPPGVIDFHKAKGEQNR